MQVYVYVGTGMQALATEERVNALIHHMERNLSKGQLVWALEVSGSMLAERQHHTSPRTACVPLHLP